MPVQAEPYCKDLTSGGTLCFTPSSKAGWDFYDYVGFDLEGYKWVGSISCRDNPTTYTWYVETHSGYAPEYLLEKVGSNWCEARLY